MSNTMHAPHTNAKGLAKHRGQNVRLWAKVLKFQGETAIVQASDGAEVKIKMLRGVSITDPFVEIIGKVDEGNVMSMLACTDLGSDFTDKDLENYNRSVEACEHPKFRHLFFPP